jgi:putative MATE family efflux protein
MEEEMDGPGRRATPFSQDWTSGSIPRNLLSLSWPIVISYGLNTLGPTIDMIWVGKLGAASIAGVGVSGMAIYVINSMRLGLTTGVRAMVSRFVGAGDVDSANHVAQQGFVISAVFSALLAAAGMLLAEPLLTVMGVEADVVAEGAAYMRIMLVGSAAMSFRMLSDTIMQASGDTIVPMRIAIGFRVLHVALAPALIFGWWVFPSLGVRGAAVTNVFSQSLGAALGLWVLFAGRSRLRLTFRHFRLDPRIIWRLLKIGIPASVMMTQDSITYFLLTWFMIPFGTLAVAAHAVVLRIEMVLFMPSWGLGMAAGILVGQNLGARLPHRAARSGWLATGLAEVVTVVLSAVLFIWAEAVVGVFTSDSELIPVASVYLRIAVVGFVLLAVMAVIMQSLSGAGDTVPLMVVGIVMGWLVQLPLAYFLPRVTDMGELGVRWAMVIGLAVGAIAYLAYFRSGRWQRKRV